MIKKWYAADFETSNSKINIEQEYTRVWAWDIFDPNLRLHITGYDIETFFDKLFLMPSCILYFHNLKFDGAFILSYLLDVGFEISDDGKDCSISTLITDRLVWYTFEVHFNRKTYIFRDSLKKISGTLRDAAKAFNLPIEKGEIDYTVHRDKGYIPTEEEIKYLHTDTEILGDILKYYYENGMTSLTNATDAMKSYKNIIGNISYKEYFPIVPKPVDDFIRRSYKGGFCFLNPKFWNKDLNEVYCYDVKSMYPSVMSEMELPYGVPQHYNGEYVEDKAYPLYIQEINVDCDLKEGRIPSIQSKAFMTIKLQYLKSTNGQMRNMVLTSLDLEHLFRDYEIHDIEFIQGYKFRSSFNLFYDYVNYYFPLKEKSKGAKKQLYKIFLNSLYGKFAMMTERQQAIPEKVNGELKYKRSGIEEVDAQYTAVASFITSWARWKLLSGIYANLDNFIYCDTDSMHLIKPANGVKIGNNLGEWNIEHGEYINGKPVTYVNKARYLGQKCYMLAEIKNNKEMMVKKIAGAPDTVKQQIDFSNFYVNFTSDADKFPKFRMKNVKGGVILIPTTFTIKQK